VRYALQNGDTDTPGTYKAEYQVTFPDGSIETFKNTPDQLRVVITPELG
jgi:Rib/alpha/Esp surface antigen-like repeat protein